MPICQYYSYYAVLRAAVTDGCWLKIHYLQNYLLLIRLIRANFNLIRGYWSS